MIHYTYNSAPFLQESELLELITIKYVGIFFYHNYEHLGTFFGTTALAAKVPAECSEHRNQAGRQSKHRNQAGAAHEYVGHFFLS